MNNKITLLISGSGTMSGKQTTKYMPRVDRDLVEITTSNLTVDYVKSLGDPSKVPLIHFYLSQDCDSRVLQVILDLNRLGYIMMFSLNSVEPSSNSKSFLYSLGLTFQKETWNMNHPISFYTASNTLFQLSGYTSAGLTISYKPSANNFGASILKSNLKVPIIDIAYTDNSSTSVYFGIFESGTALSDGTISRAPIIFGGFLYTSDVHFENMYSILDDIYNYCDNNSNPRFIIEGFISTSKRIPLIRKVTVHRQTNGQLLNRTMSDENGYYKLGLPNDDPVFIVCHPEDSRKRGLIHTYVIPVENERD